ncbi:MAG: hypothetical protein M2R45_00623 [Verrucomicrobia subdivision 3 bacterium]|nr:hypothetical protein [Limisphaerales bacterium]MCS1414494.1 hypothetical protein [Limisphaerales bacterium]
MKENWLEESEFEEGLRKLRPRAVPPSVVDHWVKAARDAAMRDRNDVPVSEGHDRGVFGNKTCRRSVWLAAALILLVGLVGTLMVQGPDEPGGLSEVVSISDPLISPLRGLKAAEGFAFRPEALESQLIHASDDGIVAIVGDVPFRRVRYQLVDAYRWSSAPDGVFLEYQIPREEVLLLPVVTY